MDTDSLGGSSLPIHNMHASTLIFGYTFDGPYKVDLPESVLQSISDAGALPDSPLTFRVNDAWVGIREFSAPEGQIGMSAHLAETLGIEIGAPIEIERGDLLKGTQITFLTTSDPMVDWKSLLEAWIPRNYTALAVGTTLRIPYLGSIHELTVTHLEPEAPAVCVVDTDMDLLIDATAGVTSEVQLPELELGKEIDLGPRQATLSMAVPSNVYTLYLRSSDLAYIGPEFATSPTSFVSVAGAEEVSVSTAFLGGTLSVTATGTFSVNTEPAENNMSDIASRRPTAAAGPGEAICDNCGKHVPEQSILLHSNFCQRNTAKCDECGRAFSGMREVPHAHIEAHEIRKSRGKKCECGTFESRELSTLALHRASTCPLRNQICQFCHLLLPQDETSPVDAAQGLTGHEAQCGNRTTDCPLCSKPVRLRSFAAHLQEHDEQRRHRQPPPLCSNLNCPNPVDTNMKIPLGLCATCFGPLSVPGANTDTARIKARAERRYVIQMMRGCGQSWCQNQYCKTGSSHTSTSADAVKKARDILSSGDQWFCVDETSTRKAMFVQLDDGEYARGWRGMAINSCASELEAERWLEAKASRRSEQSF